MQQGAVLLGMVSLFPAENGVEGSVSPFRSDILSLLKGLQPRHVPSTISLHPGQGPRSLAPLLSNLDHYACSAEQHCVCWAYTCSEATSQPEDSFSGVAVAQHIAGCKCSLIPSRSCHCLEAGWQTGLSRALPAGFCASRAAAYVEGVTLANAFYWKPSVGPLEQRPGHWNGMWQYWSTDGAWPASAMSLQQSCCASQLLVGVAQTHCSWLQMCLVEKGCTVRCRSVAVESQKKSRA